MKGQAATEFIMTYGWAILAVMVSIGALAYFGVLNTENLTPERCTSESAFPCKDYQLKLADDGLHARFLVENKNGGAIRVTRVVATSGADSSVDDCGESTPFVIANEGTKSFNCTLENTNPRIGKKWKVQYKLDYTAVNGGSYSHTITGDIFANVVG